MTSSAWLLGERGVTFALNFLVGILIARYLGPERLGALSYATAFIALLSSISYLGFMGVVVQELVRDPDNHGTTMGTVIYLKLAAASLAFLLANLIAYLTVGDVAERLLILLVSFSLLFDVSSATRLHFEARTQGRPVAMVSSGATIIAALGRVAAVATSAPLWVFAALVSAQACVAAFGYAVAYTRSEGRSRLRFSIRHTGLLLGKSWPLIISSAAAIVYLKIDQIMLGQMRGLADVGTYATAARMSEVWYFLPDAIAVSIFPRLVQLKSSNPEAYSHRIQDSIRYLFWLALAIAVPVSLAAPPIITFVYGEPYRAAGMILTIHVWACPAVFMGKIVDKWFVTENLLKYLIGRQAIGAATNVALNLVLIPRYGGVGAAVATLVSYTSAHYFSCFISRRTRPAGVWMTKAIFWPLLSKKMRRAL